MSCVNLSDRKDISIKRLFVTNWLGGKSGFEIKIESGIGSSTGDQITIDDSTAYDLIDALNTLLGGPESEGEVFIGTCKQCGTRENLIIFEQDCYLYCPEHHAAVVALSEADAEAEAAA